MSTKPVWSRSVKVDRTGIAWSTYGVRADFVFTLFAHGYSIEELSTDLIDGQAIPRAAIEDIIRYGLQKAKEVAPR